MDATPDIHTLNAFRENTEELIARLKVTHRPMMLTVDGHAEIVVQEAAAYQRLLDLAALADPDEGLRQGLEEIAEGQTVPARQVFAALREAYGVRG
ncbi:prevent-host-death protein [Granulicella sp. 5B5]|nr:prevent-host-death protein [Granulicella sp. 5B5]